MSKIGKQPINIPEGVSVMIENDKIKIKGPKGEMDISILSGIRVSVEEKQIIVFPEMENKDNKSFWGTQRALIANTVQGVREGYEKILILDGVGYRMTKEGSDLVFSLGFSHPVKFKVPQGIVCEIEKNTLKIKGINKEKVGQVAAEIRSLKEPEPYKGKGFRYSDEIIRRKAGKKAAATTGTK